MNHYVYEVTNMVNGKKYIGKRSCMCSIEEDQYMGSGKIIKRALDKYGVDSFSKEILEICESEDDAYHKERHYIEDVQAWKNNMYYNIDGGGRGVGSGESHPMFRKNIWEFMQNPDETKKKISESMKGRTQSEEHIEKKQKRVVSINNGMVFDSIKKASLYYRCGRHRISRVCHGKECYAGKLHTGEHIVWMFYNDWIKLTEKDIEYKLQEMMSSNIKNKKPRKVSKSKSSIRIICLNNLKVFESMLDASKEYKIDTGSISKCCSGKRKYAGRINGEQCQWMYYNDYLKLNS